MTETFKKANHIMKLVANAAACAVAYAKYNSKNAEAKAHHYEYRVKTDMFDRIKKEVDGSFWKDVFNLSYEERFMLRFRKWDDDEEHLLIPLWIIECLPDDFDIEVTGISGGKYSIKEIDKDIRCGCVAYMV